MSVSSSLKASSQELSFKIEEATESSDLRQIVSLINAAYKKAKFLQEGVDRISYDEVRGLLSDPCKKLYLCISSSNEICGTILLKFINDTQAEIGLFAISPHYQGKKIAPLFLNYVEEEAFKKVREILLEVIPFSQENLIGFYERMGYRSTGQIVPFPNEAKLRYIRPEHREQVFISMMHKIRF